MFVNITIKIFHHYQILLMITIIIRNRHYATHTHVQIWVGQKLPMCKACTLVSIIEAQSHQ